ncbi:MAG TPA: PEP-CTERM sorting domain-containing protein [Tepidisphaeraceae bacterium]|nr:PEP-CTERM sorting domain-containing protein [Tepidisphaeraceae bacterium]
MASVAFFGFAAHVAHADTITLGGSYNNSPSPPGDGDGYDAYGPDSYLVLPTATFDSNSSDGLDADSGATVTVTGGEFENNAYGAGIGIYPTPTDLATVDVSGGTFAGNADGILDTYGILNVGGGTFSGSEFAIRASYQSQITVTGGAFSATNADFYLEEGTTSFDVYGQFADMIPGQTKTLDALPSPQSFTGTLEYDTLPQTFTYSGDTTNGTPAITLHDVAAVPEPTAAALSIAAIGLVTLRRRRQRPGNRRCPRASLIPCPVIGG